MSINVYQIVLKGRKEAVKVAADAAPELDPAGEGPLLFKIGDDVVASFARAQVEAILLHEIRP